MEIKKNAEWGWPEINASGKWNLNRNCVWQTHKLPFLILAWALDFVLINYHSGFCISRHFDQSGSPVAVRLVTNLICSLFPLLAADAAAAPGGRHQFCNARHV